MNNNLTGINSMARDVREFHAALAPELIGDAPRMLPHERITARAKWLREEADEAVCAINIAEQADAFIDSAYFAIGGLVDMGIDPLPLWQIVHNANMSKIWPDGTVHRREDGKILKPPGWLDPGPLIELEIQRQISNAHVQTSFDKSVAQSLMNGERNPPQEA